MTKTTQERNRQIVLEAFGGGAKGYTDYPTLAEKAVS